MSAFDSQEKIADQLIAELGMTRLILLAHELERRKQAVLPQPDIHLLISAKDWAAIVEYFRAPQWPEEEGGGGVDWRVQAVADAIASGSPEETFLAALRLARKIWHLQPHLGSLERAIPALPPAPSEPPSYPALPTIVDDGIDVP